MEVMVFNSICVQDFVSQRIQECEYCGKWDQTRNFKFRFTTRSTTNGGSICFILIRTYVC